MNNTWYVCQYSSGELVAIDNNSGGYPYKAINPGEVRYWNDESLAQKYADMFKFTVKKFIFEVE